MKLCIDCKHYASHNGVNHWCNRDKTESTNPVTGYVTLIGVLSCDTERKSTSGCGLVPRYWEAK